MSFFTKRSTYASTRLRFLGRGMQVFGVLIYALSVAATYSMRSAPIAIKPDVLDLVLKNVIIYGGLRMLSYVFIGRALLRREKWGAYAAVVAIGLPAAIQLIWPPPHDPLHTVSLLAAFATLALIASVKYELGSVLDSELADHGKPPEPVEQFTPRNRGFGEPRAGSVPLPQELAPTLEIAKARAPMSTTLRGNTDS